MKKYFLIILPLFLLVCACIIGWWLYSKKQNGELPTIGELPGETTGGSTSTPESSNQVQHPTGDTLTIGTPSGIVTVKNFYRTGEQQEGGSVLITKTATYFISYDSLSSDFWVGINNDSFDASRRDAENAFLAELGISQSDACRLNVLVTPYQIDMRRTDTSLSFCPGK